MDSDCSAIKLYKWYQSKNLDWCVDNKVHTMDRDGTLKFHMGELIKIYAREALEGK